MKLRALLMLISMIAAQVSIADDVTNYQSILSWSDCKRLASKKGLVNVLGGDYQSGKDVYGRPVIPADLNSNAESYFGSIVIKITTDLVKRYGLDPLLFSQGAQVGSIEIDPDGKVKLNGKPISHSSELIARLCTQPSSPQN